CSLFDYLLTFQSDDLLARYGDEIRSVFQDELTDAWQRGSPAILKVWTGAFSETIALTAPRYAARLRLLLAASALASALTLATVLGFCTIGPTSVHASSQQQTQPQTSPHAATPV